MWCFILSFLWPGLWASSLNLYDYTCSITGKRTLTSFRWNPVEISDKLATNFHWIPPKEGTRLALASNCTLQTNFGQWEDSVGGIDSDATLTNDYCYNYNCFLILKFLKNVWLSQLWILATNLNLLWTFPLKNYLIWDWGLCSNSTEGASTVILLTFWKLLLGLWEREGRTEKSEGVCD